MRWGEKEQEFQASQLHSETLSYKNKKGGKIVLAVIEN